MISRWEETERRQAEIPCNPAKDIFPSSTPQLPGASLNADGFGLMVWNMRKGSKAGWQAEFANLMEDTDLLVLQEAYLTEALRVLLQVRGFKWHMVPAFDLNGIPAGVLTASIGKPEFLCAFKTEEPFLKIPKSTLVTRHPVSGARKPLMVVNLHLINITVGGAGFKNQIRRICRFVSKHTGPLILAGDFNTWSDQRLKIVQTQIDRLGLQPVRFEKERRRKFFGHFLDHIYYRNLQIREARVVPVNSSDHNPMVVRFSVNEKRPIPSPDIS